MRANVYDAAIAGGGPAGAAAAIVLARAGLRVLLADAGNARSPRHGKYKIGEGLPPSARHLLRDLGVHERVLADGHRPCHGITGVAALIEPSDKFSFPSGHTAAAFVFAAVLAAFYPLLALPAFVLATLIGLSRVMLGVHYPGDIVAGAVLGLLSAAAALQWLGV